LALEGGMLRLSSRPKMFLTTTSTELRQTLASKVAQFVQNLGHEQDLPMGKAVRSSPVCGTKKNDHPLYQQPQKEPKNVVHPQKHCTYKGPKGLPNLTAEALSNKSKVKDN